MEKLAIAEKRTFVALLLLLSWLSIFGCAGLGRVVPAEERILFTEKESVEGVFSSSPLMMSFSYTLKGRNLQLKGSVDYSGGYDSLNVYVLFIDASGTVLQRNLVYYSGYRVGFWPGGNTFQADLNVPANAAGFSFSHSAQAKTIRR